MVLDERHEAIARVDRRRGAVPAAAVRRVLPVVDEAGRDRLAQVGDAPEVGEVAAPVAGDDGVQRVVKVVAPLRVEAQAADLAGPDHARVVEVALGDQPGVPAPARAASA